MSDITQEISEDYDHDAAEVMYESDMDEKLISLESMSQEMGQLYDAVAAVESFGINPTAFAVMQTTGLLSGTSIDALAMESFTLHTAEDAETLMAVESLMDKVKEKTAGWSAKVLTFVKSMNEKALGMLSSLWDKVVDAGKVITTKVWDKAKEAGNVIKAHPYKSITAAIGAVATVAAVFALISSGSSADFSSKPALQNFMSRISALMNKIKFPGANVVSRVEDVKILYTVETNHVTYATVVSKEIGWNQAAARAASGQASSAWATLKSSISGLGGKIVGIAKTINGSTSDELGKKLTEKVAETTGSRFVGGMGADTLKKIYSVGFTALLGIAYKLLKNVVLKAFQMIVSTFKALRSNVEDTPKTT